MTRGRFGSVEAKDAGFKGQTPADLCAGRLAFDRLSDPRFFNFQLPTAGGNGHDRARLL